MKSGAAPYQRVKWGGGKRCGRKQGSRFSEGTNKRKKQRDLSIGKDATSISSPPPKGNVAS